MLSQKYLKDFLNTNDKYDFNSALNKISKQEKISGVSFLNWEESEIGDYLRSFNSVSAMALNRQLSVLRNFADFICEKENLPKKIYSLGEDKLYDFIDKEKLNSITISFEQYRHIKNQFDENVRDKLIFEFAWYGLSNEEIKMIQLQDIKFTQSDFGWDIALINIGKDIPFKIEDPEVVEDIKKCMNETFHFISAKDGKTKKMKYKDSNYLIKPINVGKRKKEDYISNPSLTLQKALITKKCADIDVSNLSIEDIRRSGLVYLLSPENEKEFSIWLQK